MRDVYVTGAARVVTAPGGEIKPAAWAHKPARLARMDRLCALALVAADAALADAGVKVAGWNGERVAVVVGTAFGCHATNEEYYRGLIAEGASPRLFAYTLPSSPAGEITIHYGARGPAETVASGRQAGIEAVERAARLFAGGKADLAIAVAAEVAGGTLPGLGLDVAEGAAALVIERGAAERAKGRIAGAGSAFRAGKGREAMAAAVALAAAEAGREPSLVLAVTEGDGAVEGLAALVDWLGNGNGNEWAVAATGDRRSDGGGAAAVVAVRG
jgi:hypothetical protein